jgi:hypothetical protein
MAIISAQLPHDGGGNFCMFPNQLQEVVPSYEVHLAWLQGLGRQFIRPARNRRVQPQYFPWLANSNDQSLTVRRVHGQFHAAFA